jgi:hypothetical protein
MKEFIFSIIILVFIYVQFSNCRIIKIEPTIEHMKNIDYRNGNSIYKLTKI